MEIEISFIKETKVTHLVNVEFPFYGKYSSHDDWREYLSIKKINQDGTWVELHVQQSYSDNNPEFEVSYGLGKIATLVGDYVSPDRGYEQEASDEKEFNYLYNRFMQAMEKCK